MFAPRKWHNIERTTQQNANGPVTGIEQIWSIEMNHGGKILIGCFAFAAAALIIGCIYESYHPTNKGWTGHLSHCEVHADRPLEEVLIEVRYENESSQDRGVREAEERAQNTDFGSMS